MYAWWGSHTPQKSGGGGGAGGDQGRTIQTAQHSVSEQGGGVRHGEGRRALRTHTHTSGVEVAWLLLLLLLLLLA